MGEEPLDANNARSGQASTQDEQEYISQSLRDFALILHKYLEVLNSNAK